ncbi:MAG: hypothetical protein K9N55_19315 [Phycisphaerae bacterium]|nr:hypothetical protein [Phycisphaerae bacterium]
MIIHGTTAVHLTDKVFDQTQSHPTLQGWLTSEAYAKTIERSIIVAPLLSSQHACYHRLGPEGEILYSSLDSIDKTELGTVFEKIEAHFKVRLVYGFQCYFHPITGVASRVETLLLDVQHMNRVILNDCKRELYEAFGIQSHRFEHLWAYEQCVRLAPVTLAALEALNATDDMTTLISHNVIGIPTLLCAMKQPSCHATTVFCAHEVPCARKIIEEHPGHDTMFYNVMERAPQNNLHLHDIFGEVCLTFQHTLTQAASHCHRVLAVGHNVARELRFLAPEFESKAIDIVYQGLSTRPVTYAAIRHSKEKLQSYCDTLLQYKPDWVFSHVAKRIKSKALWRDLRVLSALDREFQDTGQTGVMFMVCTDATAKPARDIRQMESNYGWPVAHREGMPDLIDEEIPFFDAVQTFNARARNIKILFINQDGFDATSCGQRMCKDMTQADLCQGTDVEFGQSIYEPCGSPQLEPVAYGALCVLNRICGCTQWVETIAQDIPDNLIIADYTDIGDCHPDLENVLQLSQATRDQIEQAASRQVARDILDRLPQNEIQAQALLKAGSNLTQQINWESIITDYLCPALQNNLILH